MKCQKCNATLKAGHLYCDVCGTEVQMVPDFEPEIENSIAKTLSNVGETILAHETVNTEQSPQQNTLENGKKFPFNRKAGLGLIFLVLFCLLVIIGYRHSLSYQAKKATDAWNSGNYDEAITLCHILLQKDENNPLWQIMILLQEENYQKVHDILADSDGEKIPPEFYVYLCQTPESNFESGFYEDYLEIELTGQNGSQIFYTLDGSEPSKHSTAYTKPFTLSNGTHIVKAICYNSNEVYSDIVEWEYEIEAITPHAPEVLPSSGIYSSAQMIEVVVEEGTKVYYTMNLSKPTQESILYTKPLPMPLGESRYVFVAYSGKGVPGECTQRNYMLNLKTGLTKEEAESVLVQKLIEIGYLLDRNGALRDRYGVFRYFYQYPIAVQEHNYYVFAERYLENEINDPTDTYYAVEVVDGNVCRLKQQEDGNWEIVDF